MWVSNAVMRNFTQSKRNNKKAVRMLADSTSVYADSTFVLNSMVPANGNIAIV